MKTQGVGFPSDAELLQSFSSWKADGRLSQLRNMKKPNQDIASDDEEMLEKMGGTDARVAFDSFMSLIR